MPEFYLVGTHVQIRFASGSWTTVSRQYIDFALSSDEVNEGDKQVFGDALKFLEEMEEKLASVDRSEYGVEAIGDSVVRIFDMSGKTLVMNRSSLLLSVLNTQDNRHAFSEETAWLGVLRKYNDAFIALESQVTTDKIRSMVDEMKIEAKTDR